MGYDIEGVKPKNKKGEYFRNNCWWWRKLWSFSVKVTDVKDKDKLHTKGNTNDGYKVTKKEKEFMLVGLKQALLDKDSGNYNDNKRIRDILGLVNLELSQYIDLTKEGYEQMYPFSWDNVKEWIEFLENNEGFKVY